MRSKYSTSYLAVERYKEIAEMRCEFKMTLQAIGDKLHISRARVGQILKQKSYYKKLTERTFPRRIKIMFDNEEKTLLTRY